MACIGYCVWDFRMCGGGLGNDVVVVSGGVRVWRMMIGVCVVPFALMHSTFNVYGLCCVMHG